MLELFKIGVFDWNFLKMSGNFWLDARQWEFTLLCTVYFVFQLIFLNLVLRCSSGTWKKFDTLGSRLWLNWNKTQSRANYFLLLSQGLAVYLIMPHESWGFSCLILTDGHRYNSWPCVSTGHCYRSSFWMGLSWPLVVSLSTCADWYSAEYLKATICRSAE